MTPPAETKLAPWGPLLLVTLAAAECLLSLFQWMELILVRSGGRAVCSVSDTLNCETVWNSDFAARLHGLTQIPVAGLGIVWGATALGMALLVIHRGLSGRELRPAVVGTRATALAGALSCVMFATASFRSGALCLTCLGTYALVLGYLGVAFKGLPGKLDLSLPDLKKAGPWMLTFAGAAFLLCLVPGLRTPRASATSLNALPTAPTPTATQAPTAPTSPPPPAPGPTQLPASEKELAAFLASLPAGEQLAVSESLAVYKASAPKGLEKYPVRLREGPADAPLHIVDFTDIRCPHCKHLLDVMKELKRVLPEGSFSVEPRQFPLDGECNKVIAQSDGSGVRCMGAKAQICLEGSPDFWRIRDQLFAHQEGLTKDLLLEIASSGSVSRAAMEACLQSPATQAKLVQDIAYAMQFNPQGTPLVVVNGHEGTPVPVFLYAMALTRGNADSPAFAKLPPPPPPSPVEP